MTPVPFVLLAALLLPAIPALAADSVSGDAAAGQTAFSTCRACHSAAAGTNGVGPSLAGVVGRPSGSLSGYAYSPAMKAAHVTWDSATLDRFIANPQSVVRGTKMFVSVPRPTTRRDIIAYLATLK